MAKKRTRAATKQDSPSPATPGKEKPEKLTIIIPPTPVSSTTADPPSKPDRVKSPEHETWTTPPTSAKTPVHKLKLQPMPDSPLKQWGDLDLKAESTISPDIVALAEFHASMKRALQNLTDTFDRIEVQSSQMYRYGLDIKAKEQLTRLRADLQDQIDRQKTELDTVRSALKTRIKNAFAERIKSQMYDLIKDSVSKVIETRVRDELTKQIPENVRQQGMGHQRQILEVKTNLHNSEARRYNASLQSASLTVPLRPLLRPLPTPEQSPVPILPTTSVSSSTSPSPLPLSAFPHAPAPTPIKRSLSNLPSSISRSQSLQPIPPTPSALFPKDLKTLFGLGPDAARTLLREYGLESTASSPIAEETKQKAPKPPPSASAAAAAKDSIAEESESEEEDIHAHVQDMNKFMAHIGVPFLMVPPPKQKETNAERRRKLAPLIINTSASVR